MVSELSTKQLRHLVLAKLPPVVSVEAWGADRAALLQICADANMYTVSKADLEEVGPAERSASTVSMERGFSQKIQVAKANRSATGLSPTFKLYAQIALCCALILVQSGRLLRLQEWMGLKSPLPACPKPQWWQAPLPSSWRPGAAGECRL